MVKNFRIFLAARTSDRSLTIIKYTLCPSVHRSEGHILLNMSQDNLKIQNYSSSITSNINLIATAIKKIDSNFCNIISFI